MKKKCIIFDFDGTLFNLNVDWKNAYEKCRDVFYEYGLKFDLNKHTFLDNVKIGCRTLQRNKQDLSIFINGIEGILTEFEMKANASLIDGAMENLKWLRDKGVKIAILSNNSRLCIEKNIPEFELEEPDVISGRNLKYPKPSTHGAKAILKKLELRASECLLVGDQETDMEVGKQLKMETLNINEGFDKIKEVVR
jgi:beta-phosphoglucomutase-like phosphatase (HAD superfamily)